ncbi:DUF4145 domain-containing protein [Caulobacter sp.]|uniref:DUF4145 domain-containing protein n=1 Tax=Caulobacter sp. TaxID=78 RepID=UPI003BAB1E51
MLKVTGSAKASEPFKVSIRCPGCGQNGTFESISGTKDTSWDGGYSSAGIRVCPNSSCGTVASIFVDNGVLDNIYPVALIDFDSKSLPKVIKNSLEEAIACHGAKAYRASALMVRRVLEELCEDRGAKGSNLDARLKSLGTTIVIPQSLLDAANELRLLGNDAAHIESKNYDAITQEEATIAIELAKELLKAVYQYDDLVGRLKALKRSPP